jgi:hypothetical protein
VLLSSDFAKIPSLPGSWMTMAGPERHPTERASSWPVEAQ